MSGFKMPEPVIIDRHIPTNIVIRGYTKEHIRQAAIDALEMAAVRLQSDNDNHSAIIRALKEQIK